MNCVRKFLKQCGWAWDQVCRNRYSTVVSPSEECRREIDPVTITVRLERGSRAGGWWVETNDSTWGNHHARLLDALRCAEKIREDREALMQRVEAEHFEMAQRAYIEAMVDYLRNDTGACTETSETLKEMAWSLPDRLLEAAEALVQQTLYKLGVTLSGAPIVMAS